MEIEGFICIPCVFIYFKKDGVVQIRVVNISWVVMYLFNLIAITWPPPQQAQHSETMLV